MSQKKRLSELEQLVAQQARLIDALQKLLDQKPVISGQITVQDLQPQPVQRFDSFRFRGWPARCVNQSCDYPNPWNGTNPPSCRRCGQPMITNDHVVVTCGGLGPREVES